MDDKLVHKFINKIKDKFVTPKQTYPETFEYAFSNEELESINKQNKQKIQELKQDIFSKKKELKDTVKVEEVIAIKEEDTNKVEETESNNEIKELVDEVIEPLEEVVDNSTIEVKEEPQRNSFINLSEEHQKIVMDKWNDIKLNKIDKDIIEAKDLLNHNYTITYADDAARFIHYIRKEYEVVICYLIGFNNEKQGIYEKTYFSNKMDDEWKHLNSYIKILEKIRNFKK